MRAACLACLVLAGCGTQSTAPFLLETTDCALVNNFQVNGAATAWSDCRLYWSGSSNVLTVELVQPGTTGSFVAPAASWIRASVTVPAGGVHANLAATAFPSGGLPTSLAANQLALGMAITGCANLGASHTGTVETMADVGAESASFSMKLSGTCSGTTYTGGFIVTAAAQDGSMTTADPATPVTIP